MDRDPRQELRFFKTYSVVASTVAVVVALAAFQQAEPRQRFGEIDVERINVVETDGTLRFVISNKARYPGLIIRGKEYPHPRDQAGLLFFNDEGTENGGLYAGGRRNPDGTFGASGGILFDQYEQDQTLGLQYSDQNGRRSAVLRVWDRPNTPILEFFQEVQRVRAMPDGPEKQRALAALSSQAGFTRVVVGKTPDRAATVMLADPSGRPRLRMAVDSAGTPRIEFLDESGRVTHALPEGAARPPARD